VTAVTHPVRPPCRPSDTDQRACVEDLRAIVEADEDKVPDPRLWGAQTSRFHELVMQRSGNKTLAGQGGVLEDIAPVDRM
jgi:hypothetical protein